ncbi:DUF2213 domain-containing protein [Burkholderia glumae]|uniref:DUF2213 domain-containing protein n=1 Tax=Burkholderia glumae TaxID=337 RepID=UPI0020CE8651|nr:DUF2213 domain-containing protein [Burkholderia glumae]MCQ0032576.1 DUF2213 domain-containing protein [Burkholderia glumae]MCQ0035786.1 DUF2213 domain-containing protein [Burkholderia glumae]
MTILRIRTADHACVCGGAHAAPARVHTRDGITDSGVLTAEQIGERQSLTPEGFLLCEAVPIARTGTQDYVYSELPELEAKDGIIIAERDADVLFDPETLASFETKTVTIDHPPDFVTPANYMTVTRGTVRNVRRGEGAQSELMLADLLIEDAEAIRRVQAKELTQVSNGYDADYEQIAPGRARQVRIVGNHVALVKNARCGPVCSIGDSSPNLLPTGDSRMAKKSLSKIGDAIRKAFNTRDSDALEKSITEMTGDEGDEPGDGQPQIHIHMPGTAEAKPAAGATSDEGGGTGADDPIAKVLAAVQGVDGKLTALADRVTKLEAGGTPTGDVDPDDDPDGDPTMDSDPDDNSDTKAAKTGDSKGLADEFRQALSLAEILAPGVRLPTFDAKAVRKKTSDSLCVLRRRALRAALDNENAETVKSVLGGADVTGMPCAVVAGYFNAAAALVKGKNTAAMTRQTGDAAGGASGATKKDINAVHAEFWANHK